MKLKRRNHSVPELSMASMPDLIFTVLFFFMIVTHMRQNTPLLQYEQPKGEHLTKVANKAAVINIYVGKAQKDGAYQVQVGNRLCTLDNIAQQLAQERERVPAYEMDHLSASLQADARVPMRIINKVKQALREAQITKINYSAQENETIPLTTR